MNTTTINLKIDTALKDEAAGVADELGMSLGTLIKVLLKQTVRKKGLQVDLYEERYPAERMTPEMERVIGEVDDEIRNGTLETLSHEEFIAMLREAQEKQRQDTTR